MAVAFNDAFAAVRPQFEDVFGELMRLEPQDTSTRRSRYVVGAPAATRDLVGIFTDKVVDSRVQGAGANSHENVDFVADNARVDFSAALFDDTTLPQEGWVVVLTSRVGQPRWRIASVMPDSVSRVVCPVTPLGPTPVTP